MTVEIYQRKNNDLEILLDDPEDKLRKTIYENILRELSKDADDHDFSKVPDIYDILTLTDDTLAQDTVESPGLKVFKDFMKYNLFGSNSFNTDVTSAACIGRQLARIGEDISQNYEEQLGIMITQLRITPETAYESFMEVAYHMYSDGVWSRERLIVLSSFGLTLVKHVIQKLVKRTAENIIQSINSDTKWLSGQVNIKGHTTSSKSRLMIGAGIFSGVLVASFLIR